MFEFISFLFKYTTIFICILYAYAKLLRIELKTWDLFDILLFIGFSVVLYIVNLYVKILVPTGYLLLGFTFLFFRFKKTFRETITVSIIAAGLSIALYIFSFAAAALPSTLFEFINNNNLEYLLGQILQSAIQIASAFFLFRIRRFQSGLNLNNKNATIDILLYISVVCVFTMMLLYAEDVKEYMLKVVILVISLSGLLLILWWRRHITYTYREAIDKRNVEQTETDFEEYKAYTAEMEFQYVVYNHQFHSLNKVLPDCHALATSIASKYDCADARLLRDTLQKILDEMNITNTKCHLQTFPLSGITFIDAPILRLYIKAEQTKLKASSDISADVESWFNDLDIHDLNLLLSYLLDNAANAALDTNISQVRVELTTVKSFPAIRIYDSGEQFDEQVLAAFGIEQTTTRAGVGGSGIGLFKVFDILTNYGASFTLDEAPQQFEFTKFIEIAFDGRHCITIRTARQSVVSACSARKDFNIELIETSYNKSA